MKGISNSSEAARMLCLLAVLCVIGVSAASSSRADLEEAVQQGDMQRARNLLRAGADIDAVTPRGGTLLIEAVAQGNTEVVNRLLQLGADIEGSIGGGYTPLIAAAQSGNVPLVQLLLRAGAAVPVPGRDRDSGQTEYLAQTDNPHVNAMHATTLNLIRQQLPFLRTEAEQILHEGIEGMPYIPRDVSRLISEHKY